ncbi:MAG: glycosyltransferase [Chitinophagales bacterium]|nr:glycosyltransferase [Chitinophagales bacterium]
MIAEIIFWLCVFAVLHSYVLYPILLRMAAIGKKHNSLVFDTTDELPRLIVLMAVFNEEKVLQEKIDSIYNTHYPLDKIYVAIGSDSSTDSTNDILEANKIRYPNFLPFYFKERSGKLKIINKLQHTLREEFADAVIVMTDANVLFDANMFYQLAKHFKNEQIGLVGANVVNIGIKKTGISLQEKSYVQRENQIKYLEGLAFGAMTGAFGACYAMRASLFVPIPDGNRADDLFLTMSVIRQRKKAISEPEAICFEDVPNDVDEEYRRKSRNATSNFQNLFIFLGMLWPPYTGVAFCFFSHKVLRWIGPLFIILAYFSNLALLGQGNKFYVATFIVQTVLLSAPFVDKLLKGIGVHLVILRFVSYFYYMNLALAAGFINYLKGDKRNVWQPTKRS